MKRRQFLTTSTLAFLSLKNYSRGAQTTQKSPFGPLIDDPAGILNLPKGFSYKILSRFGETMSDGFKVPGLPDGMAAFPTKDGKVILICNHELGPKTASLGPFENNKRLPESIPIELSFNSGRDRKKPAVGGTTTLIFDPSTGKMTKQYLSLTGTDRNCSGGPMPWNSWITCEETDNLTSPYGQKHGWCFEVKATETTGIQKPIPLKALGRFNHEAVALDPNSGILYLTEDRPDGLLYRFIPTNRNNFTAGKLQALAIHGKPSADLRNYNPTSKYPSLNTALKATWIDLQETHAPKDDLRHRGFKAGAAKFARGEGIHLENGAFYICCTNGGPKHRGQIFKLTPGEEHDDLELFLQPDTTDLLTNGDNLCPAPWGGLIICEDLVNPRFAEKTALRYISPEGQIHTIAQNAKDNTEFAGSCFSPDGKYLFVNLQVHGITMAITGPWINV